MSPRRCLRLSPICLALLVLAGCRPPHYPEPAETEPHATFKIRLTHHALPTQDGSTDVTLDGYSVPFHQLLRTDAPATIALRVRPGPAGLHFATQFARSTTVSRLVPVTETYPCGTTTTKIGNFTSTTPKTCTRSVMKTQMVTQRSVVAACENFVLPDVTPGTTYLIEYSYFADHHCSVHCFLQSPPSEQGEFKLTPCNAPSGSGAR